MRRPVRWMVLCLLGILCLTPALSVESQQPDRWESPTFLGDGWWQQVATDLQGNVHITWYGLYDPTSKVDHDVLEYAFLPLSGKWQGPKDVIYTGDGGLTVRNSIAATSDGLIHVAFRAKTLHDFSSAPIYHALDARNWSKPVRVDSSGYYMDMIADRNDVLHLAISGDVDVGVPVQAGPAEASLCPSCSNLFYRRSTDGGKNWSDPVPLSLDPDTGSDRVEIVEGQSGRIYIDWDEGFDWYVGRGTPKDVRIVYSDDSGLTWSKPIMLDGGGLQDRRPIQIALTELRDKSMLVVWRYSTDVDRGIYYQISNDNGKTWTAPQTIPGIVARSINDTPLDDYNLVIDKLGAVHLFAVAQPNLFTNANAALYDVVYQQGVWTPPVRVFYDPTMLPEWPKAVLGLNNDIHLTWFIRGIQENVPRALQSTTKVLKVFYSHLPGVLPDVATEAFKPTETPPPTPTVFQNLDPTNTPFPTFEHYEKDFFVATQDTYAASVVVGGILASAAFCAVIAVIIKFLRR